MDGRTEVESVAASVVAVESSCLTEKRGFGFGGDEEEVEVEVERGVVEGCDDEGIEIEEEIMVGIVGSDVFVDVVSGGNHDSSSRNDSDSEGIVHLVSGNRGTENDDGLGGNGLGLDREVVGEGNNGFKDIGVDVLDEERNRIVSEERRGEVVAEMEAAPVSDAETEVELGKEMEDGGVVDAVRDEVLNRSLIDDKDDITELETATEEISCAGRYSHDGVLEEGEWNPGIVSVAASHCVGEERVAMVQVNDSSLDDEFVIVDTVEVINSDSQDGIPVVHEMTETVEADGMQQLQGAAVGEESNLSSKDEILVAHETTEIVTELSVSSNAYHTSASCSMAIETDDLQKEEGVAMEESNLSSKDAIPVAHETGPVAKDSVTDNTEGGNNEIMSQEDVVVFEVNKSTCKDEIVVVDFAPESSVPDDANQTSASCPSNLETDGESVPMLQEHDSSIKDKISCVNETSFKVENDSPVIDANGTHDSMNRVSISSFHHHDASDCKVKAVHCTISPIDDKKDVMEVNSLANQHIADEPQQIFEKEIVQESPIALNMKPDKDNLRICLAKNDLSMKQKVSSLCGSVGGEDVAPPELTYEHLSDVDIVIDFDDVVDVKDEVTDLDVPMEEIYCTGNTEDICAVLVTGDKEVAQCDMSMLEVHELVDTGNTEALASNQDEDLRELSDGNSFQQEIDEIDALDGSWSKKESANPGINPQSHVEMPDTFGTDFAVEGSVSNNTEKEDELDRANQIHVHEYQTESKIFAEEPYGSLNSHVQSKKEDESKIFAEGASGLPMCHVGFIDEGSNDIVFQDGSGDVQEFETMEASICDVASSAGDSSNPIQGHGFRGDDKISSDGDFGFPTSHVVLVTESNTDGVFLDESQKLNISADIQENEAMETSICEDAAFAGGLSVVIEKEDLDHKTMGEDNLCSVVPDALSVDGQASLAFGEHNADEGLNHNMPMAFEEDMSEMDKSEISEEGKIQFSSQPSSVINEQTVGVEKYTYKSDRAKVREERRIKPSSLSSVHQLGYFRPSEAADEFAVSDLVWGKVRSHPWWPGQIFDPSDASERAVKYIKKDAYLVAYFGDRTFAWNDASVLKPFRPHFSQIVKQRNSEVLQTAIDSAVEEVSRRVKLGLSCSCSPKDVSQKIECQIVENAGIREESSRRYGVDETSRAALFEPDKLVEHIRALALSPLNPCDRLELAIAEAQLSSFCHFKGYRPPPSFVLRETSFEDVPGTTSIDEPDCEIIDVKLASSGKETLKDSMQPKKERSVYELTVHTEFSPGDDDDVMDDEAWSKSFGKKRKAVDSADGDDSDRRVSAYDAKVSTALSSPKTPSFKVGDCIRRVATQLTGASSSLKPSNAQSVGDVFLLPCNSSPRENNQNITCSPESPSTSGDMLSQLQLLARDPKNRCGLLKNIIVFLSDYRKSVVSKHTVGGRSGGNRKRKNSGPVGQSTEEFEFDDVNDSYWKDKAIENCHDEQLPHNSDKGDDVYRQAVVSPPAKIHKPTRKPYTRKPRQPQRSTENHEPLADEPVEEDQSLKRKTSPAELIMNFVEGSRIPSQVSLNNMFKRFGSLKDNETEVDQDSCRARIVFKMGADAEVAYSSARTFKIFGSMQVTYQLSYSPTTSTQRELHPILLSQGQENGT